MAEAKKLLERATAYQEEAKRELEKVSLLGLEVGRPNSPALV